jgi:hypothetical protein
MEGTIKKNDFDIVDYLNLIYELKKEYDVENVTLCYNSMLKDQTEFIIELIGWDDEKINEIFLKFQLDFIVDDTIHGGRDAMNRYILRIR